MTCTEYKQPPWKNSQGQPLDSCLSCNKSRKAHSKEEGKVIFLHQGRYYTFDSMKEANEAGFWLVEYH